jgi:hypothetical protein
MNASHTVYVDMVMMQSVYWNVSFFGKYKKNMKWDMMKEERYVA